MSKEQKNLHLLCREKPVLVVGTTMTKKQISKKEREDVANYLKNKFRQHTVLFLGSSETQQAMSIYAKSNEARTGKENIVKYLSNTTNLKMVLHQAINFRKFVQEDKEIYVTLKDVVDKTNLTYSGAKEVLDIMNVAGLVRTRFIGKTQQFKVVLKDKERKLLVENLRKAAIETHEAQMSEFDEIEQWIDNGGAIDGIMAKFSENQK